LTAASVGREDVFLEDFSGETAREEGALSVGFFDELDVTEAAFFFGFGSTLAESSVVSFINESRPLGFLLAGAFFFLVSFFEFAVSELLKGSEPSLRFLAI
jgi:hypothetical protein